MVIDRRPVKAAIPYGMILYAFVVFLVIAITKTQEQDSFYFDPSPISQDVLEGDEVRLRCDVSNRKMIVFYWTMNGKTIANTSRQYQEDSDLKILRVDRNLDFGSFRCVATNVSTGIALRSTEALLNILWLDTVASVQLVKPSTVADIVEGSELILKCQVEGNPEATIEWFRNRLRLLPSDRIRFNKNRIKVSGATAADNGVYSCKARNSANSIDSSDSFLLNIAGVGAPRLKADTFSSVLLAKPNSQAVFNCEYSGAASTEWYNSNNSLIMNDTGLDRRHSVLKNGSLVIKQVEAADAGVYHCVGINDKGPAQTFAAELSLSYLNDLSDSSFEPKPESPQVIPINGKFEIRCISSKGLPNPSLRWVGPYDTALPTQGRIKAVESVLTITAAEETDSGNYTCIVENLSGKKWKSIWISVSVAPKISRPPLSVRVTEGESAIFDCRVTGSPYPVTNILWKKDDDILDVQNSKIVLSKMGETLTINDVSPLDEGNYACLVNTTGHPTVLSTYAHLYVEKQLKFRPIPVNAKLELGSNSTLRCNAEGRFVPRIRWTKNGSPQLPEKVRINDGTMYFIGVRYNDAGSYTCTATNEQGSINVTVRVDIVVKPKFKVKPLNTTTHEGSSVMLHCVASGEPAPAIHWDKNNKVEAFDQSRIKILPNGSLHITQVYMEDVGKYGCTAGNSGGFEREEIFLHVTSGSQFTSTDIRAAAENFNMMKTIIIAVCSAVAYLAIVIGLTIYCSIRLVRAKNLRKHCRNEATDKENCASAPNEMTELMESSVMRGAMSVKSDADIQSLSAVGSYNSRLNSQHSMQRGTSGLEYFRNDLQSIGMLGKGQYGDVFLAKAMNICATEPETIVVVKSLLSHADQHQAEFVREMGMYARLDHEHVSKLLGICRDKEPMFLLYEYCEWGDLKQFLIAVKKDLGKPSSRILQLNKTQKIAMCTQVASGLEYIANNRFVHKDIAARNILLTPTLNVKVANLSLCHDIYSGEYFHYRQQLIPLRWMPPEAVFDGDFSTKSDIWSFGVFLWEVFSFGEIPVRSKSDEEVLSDLNLGGACPLDSPPGCPVDVWKMINRCTLTNPRERPTFSELIIGFGELTADSEL